MAIYLETVKLLQTATAVRTEANEQYIPNNKPAANNKMVYLKTDKLHQIVTVVKKIFKKAENSVQKLHLTDLC